MVGVGAGLFCFFKGFRIYGQYRVLADTPQSSILGIAMGFLEVHGKAKPAQGRLVNSPVTRTPCLFYKVDIKKYVAGPRGGHWSHYRTVAEGVPFYLEDGTGKVLMDAHGAEYDLIRTAWRETGGISLRGIFEALREIHSPMRFLVDDDGLINYAESLNSTGRASRRCRFTEYCLLPEHWYDVAGTCVENPEPKDERDRNIIVKGLDVPTFLITWRSEAGIKQLLRKRAAKYVFGGRGVYAVAGHTGRAAAPRGGRLRAIAGASRATADCPVGAGLPCLGAARRSRTADPFAPLQVRLFASLRITSRQRAARKHGEWRGGEGGSQPRRTKSSICAAGMGFDGAGARTATRKSTCLRSSRLLRSLAFHIAPFTAAWKPVRCTPPRHRTGSSGSAPALCWSRGLKGAASGPAQERFCNEGKPHYGR